MMRIAGIVVVVLTVGSGLAAARNLTVPEGADGEKSRAEPAAKAAPQDKAAAASQGESWRFRRHNDLWWYWQPSNRWVYWDNGNWIPYEAESYAAFNASRRQHSYSSNRSTGGYQYGAWGPIRYNQYGQRQYPYSQRSSGIQQLGPVPAMGGVRSLPGWGGER